MNTIEISGVDIETDQAIQQQGKRLYSTLRFPNTMDFPGGIAAHCDPAGIPRLTVAQDRFVQMMQRETADLAELTQGMREVLVAFCTALGTNLIKGNQKYGAFPRGGKCSLLIGALADTATRNALTTPTATQLVRLVTGSVTQGANYRLHTAAKFHVDYSDEESRASRDIGEITERIDAHHEADVRKAITELRERLQYVLWDQYFDQMARNAGLSGYIRPDVLPEEVAHLKKECRDVYENKFRTLVGPPDYPSELRVKIKL